MLYFFTEILVANERNKDNSDSHLVFILEISAEDEVQQQTISKVNNSIFLHGNIALSVKAYRASI